MTQPALQKEIVPHRFLHDIPLLSTYNGPSYLAHAIAVLRDLGVPAGNVRIVPHMGHWASPEVLQDLQESRSYGLEPLDGTHLTGRLGINVRDDNRLSWLLAPMAVGLPPAGILETWGNKGLTITEGFKELYARLLDVDPEWTSSETLVARLARQLCECLTELAENAPPPPLSAGPMLFAERGRLVERPADPRAPETLPPEEPPDRDRTARELVEAMYTELFLAIGAADELGGIRWEVPVDVPAARPIDLVIGPRVTLSDVVRWIHTYPHLAIPDGPEWLWTEEDPAVQALYNAVRARIAALLETQKTGELDSDEMMALVRSYLPEYVPAYAWQYASIGGLRLASLTLGLLGAWLAEGSVLGVSPEEWRQFSEAEQEVLCALMILRCHEHGGFSLFRSAVAILCGRDVLVDLSAFRPYAPELGSPAARLGEGLRLGGDAVLHLPSITVFIPLDRTDANVHADVIGRRVGILQRLFLPLYIPVRIVYTRDWAVLGHNAELQAGAMRDPPRLDFPIDLSSGHLDGGFSDALLYGTPLAVGPMDTVKAACNP